MATESIVWHYAGTERQWWTHAACEDIFLMFDTSAHTNDGTPNVPPEEVGEHFLTCQACKDNRTCVTFRSGRPELGRFK